MAIKFPTNTKSTIDAIRNVIGRPVQFITQSGTNCPACFLDPVTDTSVDPFCTTCNGRGYTYTEVTTTISGHVSWGSQDELAWVSGGRFYQGDCGVQIEYTLDNLNVVDNSYRIVVDGKNMRVRRKILRGVPDLNRILIDLVEE